MLQKYHFIGIGGIGMSGLAKMLLSQNFIVSGSDLNASYVTDKLANLSAKIYLGHDPKNISKEMIVIYTTGIDENNPEFNEAKRLGCKMLHRSDLLLTMMNGKNTFAVAGTHGKTTTSALLTSVLVAAGLDPSYAVGGIISELKTNANIGSGNIFVAEADESDGTFLKYDPYGAIITNIDLDHMNYFLTEKALDSAFDQFMKKISTPEHLFWHGDDIRLNKLKAPGITYGFSPKCELQATHISQNKWRLNFNAKWGEKIYPKLSVNLIGQHNVLNSLSVFGLCLSLGVPESIIRKTFDSFQGVKRRCEKKGEYNGALLIDDYAHHPTEIATTLKGIHDAIGKQRLISVFQPHRYTRTRDCLGTFKGIFNPADIVFITDIFPADENPIPGITHNEIIKEVEQDFNKKISYIPRKQLAAELSQLLLPNDVMVTLGAGDITKLSGELHSIIA